MDLDVFPDTFFSGAHGVLLLVPFWVAPAAAGAFTAAPARPLVPSSAAVLAAWVAAVDDDVLDMFCLLVSLGSGSVILLRLEVPVVRLKPSLFPLVSTPESLGLEVAAPAIYQLEFSQKSESTGASLQCHF